MPRRTPAIFKESAAAFAAAVPHTLTSKQFRFIFGARRPPEREALAIAERLQWVGESIIRAATLSWCRGSFAVLRKRIISLRDSGQDPSNMCSSLVRERLFDIRREGKALSDTPREAAQACIAAVAGKHIIEFGQIIGRIVTHPGARQGAEGETMRTFELTTSCHQDATDHRLTLYNREEISDDLPGHHLVLNVSEASGAPYDQIHLSYNLYDAEIDRHPALALRVHGYCLRRYDEPFTTVVEPHQRQGMKVINSLSALRQINRKIDHAASLPALEQM